MKDPLFLLTSFIPMLTLSIGLPTIIIAAYMDIQQGEAWRQEIHNRINTVVQSSGINFNTTRPGYGEYHFHTQQIYCTNEEDWQVLNETFHQIFEFLQSDEIPDGSMLYAYRKWSSTYIIGYAYKLSIHTHVVSEFIGYDVYIEFEDC